ncbi:MAG: hypothetical protein LIO79_09955 [Rikenellaceae bacterium]|nr:hypothetical protein [Rikenellaceae bacterium]
MKKIIFGFLLCLLCIDAFSQFISKETLEISRWVLPSATIDGEDIDKGTILSFDNNKQIFTLMSNDEKIINKTISPYYLSDSADKIFEPEKMGRYDKGRYIISVSKSSDSKIEKLNSLLRGEKINPEEEITLEDLQKKGVNNFETYCYEIIRITEDALYLRLIYPERGERVRNRPVKYLKYFEN